MTAAPGARIGSVRAHAFTVPTDGPEGTEQDGTLSWDATTIVIAEATAAGQRGIGYTYGDVSAARLIESVLAPALAGADALRPAAAWRLMSERLRNAGRPGAGAMATSAVDVALWDLKARLLGLPLVELLPARHDRVPVYGSGGFTNYPLDRLAEQLAGWVERGIPRVKLKVSRHPDQDAGRLDAVRRAIGDGPELFVDANGALGRDEAARWAHRFHETWRVSWFEEPVSSDDLAGLRRVRERAPDGIEIAAGEYGYLLRDFAGLLGGDGGGDGAVDCLQADVTRCQGITGLLSVAGLADARHVDLSAHCAPAVSAHAFCAVPRLRHLEYFHDHVRVESLLFDGTPEPVDGALAPDTSRPGHGLAVRWANAEPYRVGF